MVLSRAQGPQDRPPAAQLQPALGRHSAKELVACCAQKVGRHLSGALAPGTRAAAAAEAE